MTWKGLYATAHLGAHLARHILRRLLFIKSAGLEAFLDFYREDRIPPLSPGDSEVLLGAGRCLSCGLCDSLCPVPNPGVSPSLFPHASRSIPDFAGPWDFAACDDCRKCEEICPVSVPLRRIVEYMREKNSGFVKQA